MNILRINVLAITLTVLMASTAQAQTWFTNGLIAYWPFHGNANDNAGTNNCTVFGPLLTADRFTSASSAYNFSGANGVFLQGAGSPSLALTNTTFSAWISLSQSGSVAPESSDGLISTISPVVSNGGIQLFFSRFNRNLVFEYRTATGNNLRFSSTNSSFSTNNYRQWTHVAAVLSVTASTQYTAIYVNGGLHYFTNFSGELPGYSGQPIYIGANADWSSSVREFAGSIDDVRIYNRALSSNEVASLYYYESRKKVQMVKFYNLNFDGLLVGTNYQLQASTNLLSWTNWGSPFTATSDRYTNTIPFQRVDDWNKLFFRLIP